MKTLIFTAAPNKSSFTHAIGEKLNKENSEIVNLYSEEYKLDFLEFQDKRKIPENEIVKKLHEKLSQADEYIFVFPVWWSGVPAIMKNFFDSVFISGFAFEYIESGKKELLTDKKASVYATCDAPADIYLENSNWTGVNLKTFFEKSLFGFCGIELKDFKLYGNLRLSTKEERKEFLENL